MSDVGGIVHGRSAGVPSDVTLFHGDERFLFAREGVVHEELARRDGIRGVDFWRVP